MKRAPLLLCCLVLDACASTPPDVAHPGQLVQEYAEAVRSGDIERVHALLSEDTRAALSADALRASYDANQEEAQAQAAQLAASTATAASARAEVTLEGGEKVTLTLEGERFWLAGGFLDAVTAHTPEQAVAALRRALQRHSLPGLLRILSRRTRAELEAEMRRLVEETADELDLDIQQSEDRATVRLSSGQVIELIREAGEWRVSDVR